jgi:hypothetical protein
MDPSWDINNKHVISYIFLLYYLDLPCVLGTCISLITIFPHIFKHVTHVSNKIIHPLHHLRQGLNLKTTSKYIIYHEYMLKEQKQQKKKQVSKLTQNRLVYNKFETRT